MSLSMTARWRFTASSDNTAEIDMMLGRIIAGGVCVNDTLYHFPVATCPLAGVGASGMGQYHGYDGFLTFPRQCRC